VVKLLHRIEPKLQELLPRLGIASKFTGHVSAIAIAILSLAITAVTTIPIESGCIDQEAIQIVIGDYFV
jgi:hypothetical protein